MGPQDQLEVVQEAERLGFDSVWAAEAYGSDALTPLAWWGAQTSRIKLGTSICQLSARTPTAMAMAALTLDHQLAQGLLQVAARDAAQAAIAEQHGLVGALAHQRVVDAGGAEFVDHHRGTLPLRRFEK